MTKEEKLTDELNKFERKHGIKLHDYILIELPVFKYISDERLSKAAGEELKALFVNYRADN